MIYPIILHHDLSTKFTKRLVGRIDREHAVVDSSKLETQFTESFNIGIIKGILKMIDSEFTHVMICNNDITMAEGHLEELDKIVKGKSGIFSPSCNSPHKGVMTPVGTDELREVPWVEFIAPIFSKDVLVKTGILDKDLSYGWGVELDYCYRAKNRGFKTSLCQGVGIHHEEHQSQANQAEYAHTAGQEMHHVLQTKYGDNWQEILNYPQW